MALVRQILVRVFHVRQDCYILRERKLEIFDLIRAGFELVLMKYY